MNNQEDKPQQKKIHLNLDGKIYENQNKELDDGFLTVVQFRHGYNDFFQEITKYKLRFIPDYNVKFKKKFYHLRFFEK